MASAKVLAQFYGTDAISFSATSDSSPGVVRSYSSLAACADEIGMSRIYGGIHFSFDNTAGKESGGRIGAHVAANWLLPVEQLPRLTFEEPRRGELRIRVHALVGRSFIVECSPNLRTWTSLTSHTGAPGGVLLEVEPGQGHFFFRVVHH
jgi:hypothetical protein